jgi:hypothetical protein
MWCVSRFKSAIGCAKCYPLLGPKKKRTMNRKDNCKGEEDIFRSRFASRNSGNTLLSFFGRLCWPLSLALLRSEKGNHVLYIHC